MRFLAIIFLLVAFPAFAQASESALKPLWQTIANGDQVEYQFDLNSIKKITRVRDDARQVWTKLDNFEDPVTKSVGENRSLIYIFCDTEEYSIQYVEFIDKNGDLIFDHRIAKPETNFARPGSAIKYLIKIVCEAEI